MKNYPDQTKIREYILNQYPKEACGVIINGEFIPIKNSSTTPEINFKMDNVELLKAQLKGEIEFIVHSHCYTNDHKPKFDLHPATPSQIDYVNHLNSNVPWLIYATEGENVTLPIELTAKANPELIGREFIFYVNDCFTLIRDYYSLKFNIDLPRHSPDWTWEDGAEDDCYNKYFKDWGFIIVDEKDIKQGDIIIMSVLGEYNHAGIYDGDGLMYQHLSHRLSSLDDVNKMRSFIRFVCRYKDL